MRRVVLAMFGLLMASACSQAPAAPPAPPPPSTALTTSIKSSQDIAKEYLTKTIEQAPGKLLGFQATKDVRTFGQILGHIADSQYVFCGAVLGQKGPEASAEKTATTKADLQKALADSFAFCDRAFAAVNDSTGAAEITIVDEGNMKTTKLGALSFNTAHDMEHYGNLVTYMRLNKMVPPSSQQ